MQHTRVVAVRLTHDDVTLLKHMARLQQKTMSAYVRSLIEASLDRAEKKEDTPAVWPGW